MQAPLEVAREYLSRGWAPIPLLAGEKKPLVSWRAFEEHAPSPEMVDRWWHDDPDAGVAIVTGPASRLLVVDVDPRNGGGQSLHGLHLPPTRVHATGGGGWHYLYSCSEDLGSRQAALPGVDLLSRGHIAVMPPSRHPNGQLYQVALDAPVSAAPSWALELLHRAEPAAPALDPARGIGEGQRNEMLFRAACGFARGLCSFCGGRRCTSGSPEHLIRRVAAMNAKRCNPPLPQEEVRRIGANAWTMAQPRKAGRTTNGLLLS